MVRVAGHQPHAGPVDPGEPPHRGSSGAKLDSHLAEVSRLFDAAMQSCEALGLAHAELARERNDRIIALLESIDRRLADMGRPV